MSQPETRTCLPTEQVVAQFEEAWRSGQEPTLEHFLTGVGSARADLLCRLIFTDLKCRLRAGSARIEDYLERFAELSDEQRADLIAAEYRLRRRDEPSLSEEEYLRRFPQFAEALGARLRAAASLATVTEAPTLPHPAPAPVPAPGLPAIPGYELLSVLGRGGMGVVYRARDIRLNRDVALKMILRADTSRLAVARFWAEAEVMAAVKHPHVVQVYELGEHDGRPFMAMEYVDGGSLADRLKTDARMSAQTAAGLMEKIAGGVAAAHELGIVHRDLKPANILLQGPDPQSLIPKIADFGLAKRQTNDLTATQAVMGTPAYMAPEQAAGRAKFVGPPADVWALGVMLYEALSGERPFQGDSAAALLSNIQSAEPTALHTLAQRVPRDLDTIAMKCLAKEPEQRYASAAELAEDLGRFVRGEPIAARPVGQAERLLRWVRRQPAIATAYAVSTLAVLLIGVVLVILGLWRDAEGVKQQLAVEKQETDAARQEAERQRGIAEKARDEAERERAKLAVFEYGRSVQVAHQEWRDNNVAGTRALLDNTNPRLRGWEWHYVDRICDSSLLTLKGHTQFVGSVSFSPDGSRIITAGGGGAKVWDAKTGTELVTVQHDGVGVSPSLSRDGSRIVTTWIETAKVWDARTGAELLTLKGHKENWALATVSFNPDGSRILTASADRTARVWDAKTGAELHTLKGHTDRVTSASFSPDGSRIVTASADRTAKVWDAKTGAEFLTLKGHTNKVLSASFSPDGSPIVTASADRTAKVWDAKTGAELLTLKVHTSLVSSASFSPDGSRIVTGGWDKPAKVWDAKTGAELVTLTGNRGGSASFSPDGSRIVTASGGPNASEPAKVWDAKTGAELLILKGHTGSVLSAAFSPDGSRIVTGSWDTTAKVWDAKSGAEFLILNRHTDGVTSASFSRDGSRIVTASWDETAKVWDAKSGAELLTLGVSDQGGEGILGLRDGMLSASFSPDGSRVVTGRKVSVVVPDRVATTATAKVWDAKTGAELLGLKGHKDGVHSASFSPDGSRIVTASGDKTAKVWDAKTGAELLTLKGHTNEVMSASFSPDGSRIVTASTALENEKGEVTPGTAKVWDAKTGTELLTLKGHLGGSPSASFSPDGSRIVTGSRNKPAKVWDSKTGAELLTLKTDTDHVESISFSPDGSRIVTGNYRNTAKVWDAKTGAELLTLKGHTNEVMSVSFSPDGSRIVTASRDRTAKVWDARTFGREEFPLRAAALPREN